MMIEVTGNTEISRDEFLDIMSEAEYAVVDVWNGPKMFGKVYMDYGKGSYAYPDGQPAFIDVTDYKRGNHVYLGEYLDDEDMQYFYEMDDGHPVFTIDSGNPAVLPIEITFLKSMELN
jgi:hypothetical protein